MSFAFSSIRPHRRVSIACLSLLLVHFAVCIQASSQQRLPLSRHRGWEMLERIKDDLRKHYYDSNFHGMDLDARFKSAREKIKEAQTNGQIYAILAQLLTELNDSHTIFLPPSWRLKVDYGFQMQHIGEECYVISVTPESDASKQGLRQGDLILSIDGFAPSRQNLKKIKYSYFSLQPRDGMTLNVRGYDGQTKTLTLKMRIVSGNELLKERKRAEQFFEPRYYEVDRNVIVCKLPHFYLSDKEIDRLIKQVKGRQTLILDLRGNPGGLVSTVQYFVGYFFKEPITIAQRKDRKGITAISSTSHGANYSNASLIVLIDSESKSGSEVFARTMQLKKRGVVIGDRSAGAVMISETFAHGFNRAFVDDFRNLGFGANITIADMIMPDNASLEYRGVSPDTLVLPSALDLSERRDPVLSFAVQLAGAQLDPVKAASIFPPDK